MVDVCLILEGTYPYTIGGVSKWTHTLVKNLREFKFSIVHLYADERKETKFEIPENVDSIVEVDIRNGLGFKFDFKDLIDLVPKAKVYHSLSTGFAGLLGLQVRSIIRKPLIVTEHGLYWKELEFGVNEVECGFKIFKDEKSRNEACIARREYLEIFKEIAKRCYLKADAITTVCSYNLEQQLSLVPSDEIDRVRGKFKVIENFVDFEIFDFQREITKSEKVVSFIGRVVPIKDVKTFIRAIPFILEKFHDVKFYIVGGLEQDLEYVSECFELAETLGVLDNLVFTGEANVVDYLKITDVLVLPSVTEAQPLIVLEAMSAGVPVIATSTGGIPELIDEKGFECGLLFNVGDYVGLSKNVLRILSDEEFWWKFSKNGKVKAKRFSVERFISEYNQLYSKFINGN